MNASGVKRRWGSRDEFRVTGRMAFLMLVGFFGFVMIVNLVMVRAAITTFGGVDTPSSYKAGLAFKSDEAAAAAQQERDWDVTATIEPEADGTSVSIDVLDAAGLPIVGADVTARLSHMIDERRDIVFAVTEIGSGNYSGFAHTASGWRMLDIEISKRGERLFRSRNRVMIE